MAAPHWIFAPFRLDLDNACVWRGAAQIALRPKTFAVLHYLVAHAGQLVTKDTLLAAVWPETAVSDGVLKDCMYELRRALGDSAQVPQFIATVPRRGYRFLAPVVETIDAVPGPTGSGPAAASQMPLMVPPTAPAAPPRDTSAVHPRLGIVPPPVALPPPAAERRHLTVLFCDLVDSTRLAEHLDPEDLREVVRAYHQTCAEVMQRFDGYLAQYLGDGVLIYFGYPVAHEDDAQRAVRTGLGILHALDPLNARLTLPPGERVAVRLGIHTGLVVVGDVGGGTRQEPLALGVTPNLAARLQALAAPNTLVISATTLQLLSGFFVCQPLGASLLKGLAQPLEVYQVLAETTARSRLEAAGSMSLTPLVGREQEIGLLRERWAQVKDGMGQVVLLSGEAGIGKSRLVQVLQEHVATEPQTWLTPCQCSPYFQHTAWYPVIDLLERVVLRFDRDESPPQKLRKLEAHLGQYGLPLPEAVPLFATLLSLPLAAPYAPLTLAPEQQKQQTLHAFLTILLRIAAQQPLLFVMEDLHWVDPTTLELLSLLVDQGPTARILTLLTCRPDFRPPWTGRSHLTQVALQRLPRHQAAAMIAQVAHGKALPAEVVEQVVARTDGVPLFVEELTRMVLGSSLLQEREEGYALTGPLPALAIPATLHDSLMARLDRLGAVKSLAQLGATLGHEFSSALLQAVSPWDEETVQRGLHQLIAAEFLYQRGVPPQATYVFKHALIQEAAYQSVLKSTRQQYHQRIAQVLEARFPATVETQPELVAQHYTAASLMTQAIPYWQRAGQRAIARSAYAEARQHLTTGLEVLASVPETPVRQQHELELLTALSVVLSVTLGPTASAQEPGLTRAAVLGQQVGEPSQRFAILQRLFWLRWRRAECQEEQAIAEQILGLAQRQHDPALLLGAHYMMGCCLFQVGAFALARTHLEQGMALAASQISSTPHITPGGNRDDGVSCRAMLALVLWVLGYPDQAVQRSQEALTLAHALAHPYSLAYTLFVSASLRHYRREWQTGQAHIEAALALATEHGFARYVALGAVHRGMALAMQAQGETSMAHMRQGLAAWRDMGQAEAQRALLTLLADVARHAGEVEEGLALVAKALRASEKNGQGDLLVEAYRLKGEFLRRQPVPDAPAAEACFQEALEVSRRQEAKSLELRAAMSLSRLWQQQGKRAEAYEVLAPVYSWFTEGFDTADLQEAKALLEDLAKPSGPG